ncbi:YfjI family protein [Dactylosporangium sp. CS-033363]|uniref:YfjI family protein n=1 Tax=Dactylosporangium sp. CS-033363 TaxID=3239935 RepID=UPI003D9251B2
MTAPRLQLVTGDAPPVAPAPALWDMPVPLGGRAAPPPFPVDVYPGWLADMVAGVAEFTQTDTAMAGTVALAVLSACAGGRLEVEAKPGWREPVNVFVAVIAEPGERKSPVHGALTAPLFTAQQTLAELARPRIEEAATLKDVAARAAEQAKATAARAESGKRDDATAEAVAAALAAEAITVPSLPRLVADDVTPEKLTGLMAANGGRMALISDEGGIFDTLAGRYSASPNLDPYLKGHAGRPMLVDRTGREGEYILRPALTVGVMAQPSVLRKFGGNGDLAGRGLPARFLFALPRSRAGWRNDDAAPVPEHTGERYGRQIHDLAATLAEWDDPAVVTLTDEAKAVRSEAANRIERQLRPGGTLRDIREWANKLSGTTIRLAGLLHVAHHPADGWRQPIDADRMAEAVRLTGFFIAHYQAAQHVIGDDPVTDTARSVLATLIERGMATFTRRELHRRVQRQLPKAAQVVAVLDTLAAHGWVRATDAGYELHPRAADYAEAPPDGAESGDTVTTALDGDVSAGEGKSVAVTAPR